MLGPIEVEAWTEVAVVIGGFCKEEVEVEEGSRAGRWVGLGEKRACQKINEERTVTATPLS